MHAYDQGEAREGALVGEADLGVQVEKGAVLVVDCYGRAGEEGYPGCGVPSLADEQAVDVALVLAGLGWRCQLVAEGEGGCAVIGSRA